MEAKDKAEEIVGLFDQALNTASSGRLASDNEDVNRLFAIASQLNNHLAALSRRSPNYWLEHSGANLFNHADSTEALKRLVTVREDLEAMSSAAEGLSSLTKLISAKDYAFEKGVSAMYTTATVADLHARQETWQTFRTAAHHAGISRGKVVMAIDAVRDMQNALHTFLVQKKNPQSVRDTVERHSPFFKQGDVDALKVNPWKRAAKPR